MADSYETNKKWRKKYPSKWHKGKLRYYQKSQGKQNSWKRWTYEEEKMVMDHSMTDTQLSDKLGKSVMAIQIKRGRLKRNT